jgi:5'-deoxynucleotidase YfbR-like HD superfamily hydrolase
MSDDFLTDDRLELFRRSTWAARNNDLPHNFAINVFRDSSTLSSCYARKMT